VAELDIDHIATLTRVFMESRLLLTAAELGLFARLSGHPETVAEMSKDMGWDERSLRILLDALVVMELLDKRLDRYQTSDLAIERLTEDSPASLLPTVLHGVDLWKAWSGLTERVVGSGRRPSLDPTGAFLGTMHLLAARLAPGIAAAVKLKRGGHLLDVGGGSGAYTVAFLERDRSVVATLFDRPEVLPICREYLRRAECDSQVHLVGGDFLVDELPQDQDMVLLSAIVHSLSLDDCTVFFARVLRALRPGGRVVLRDHVMSDDRLRPRAGALFAVNMLVATRAGSTYTYRELREVLEGVGFVDVTLIQQGERMDALIEAKKPLGS
jgi:hypothetical protein